MMSHIQEAISMSNEGAHLLHAGKTREALRMLRRAVSAVKDASFFPQDTEVFIKDFSAPASNQAPCFPSEDDTRLQSNSLVYMHSRPLMIPYPSLLITREDLESLVHVISIYTIFNLALACHQYGIESGTDAPLRRAVDLYYAVAGTRTTGGANIALVQCLALNNLSHLHYEQCDYEGSLYYMTCMLDLSNQTFCLDHGHGILSEHEVEEIKLNVMYLRPPSAAQAA